MYIIGDGRVLTGNGALIEGGAVITNGSTIQAVGTFNELRQKYPEAELVSANGGIIMPAFINTHHHIYSAFARGLSINGYSPKCFDDILEGLWWKLDRKLTLEDIYYSALATYIDCIKNGVTTVFDHHASYGAIGGSLERISKAADELGLRTCLCYEVSDRDGDDRMERAIKENADFFASAGKNELQRGMMGLHASFTLSNATLDLVRTHTPDWCGFHIHVAEGISDVQNTLKSYGKRIVNRLFDFDILGRMTLAVHCVHITPAEMELLKSTNTIVIHNPESNMGNAVGCPPVLEMMRRGLTVGLGTDGYTSDMLETYKAANLLHKHNTCDPAAAWEEIPRALFAGNREIAGRFFDEKLGLLQPGAAADVIVADYDPLTPMTAENMNSHILFGLTGRSISTTMCAGKLLMKDRRVLCADEREVMRRCRELSGSLWRIING